MSIFKHPPHQRSHARTLHLAADDEERSLGLVILQRVQDLPGPVARGIINGERDLFCMCGDLEEDFGISPYKPVYHFRMRSVDSPMADGAQDAVQDIVLDVLDYTDESVTALFPELHALQYTLGRVSRWSVLDKA